MGSTLSEVSHKSQKAHNGNKILQKVKSFQSLECGVVGEEWKEGGKSRGGHAMKSLGLRLHP